MLSRRSASPVPQVVCWVSYTRPRCSHSNQRSVKPFLDFVSDLYHRVGIYFLEKLNSQHKSKMRNWSVTTYQNLWIYFFFLMIINRTIGGKISSVFTVWEQCAWTNVQVSIHACFMFTHFCCWLSGFVKCSKPHLWTAALKQTIWIFFWLVFDPDKAADAYCFSVSQTLFCPFSSQSVRVL